MKVALLLVCLGVTCTSTARADRSWQVTAQDKASAVAGSKNLGFKSDGSEDGAKLSAMFQDWAEYYGQDRSPASFQSFKKNMKTVFEINSDPSQTYIASGNAFTGTDSAEFIRTHTGLLPDAGRGAGRRALSADRGDEAALAFVGSAGADEAVATGSRKLLADGNGHARALRVGKPEPGPAPAPVDVVNWATDGKVTPVRNQGQCGSCWAFAAIALVESAYLQANSGVSANSLDLSEQLMVDCSRLDGCNGGWPTDVLKYIEDKYDVVESESIYTSGGSKNENTCDPNFVGVSKVSTEPGGWSQFSTDRADTIKTALADGPIIIGFKVVSSFQAYSNGIYSSPSCGGGFINHVMLLTGWGTQGDTEYWIIKNSWGTGWGENGYIRVAIKDSNGVCQMNTYLISARYGATMTFDTTL